MRQIEKADGSDSLSNPENFMEELREYDVPYIQRVSIDLGLRVGQWYDVWRDERVVHFEKNEKLLAFPEVVVCAFDIETTKPPLKFPDVARDQVMMISYMINGDGYLIVNRETVSADIESFGFAPLEKFDSVFTVFNEANEEQTLRRFISEMHQQKVIVYVTYNGDNFDLPFLEARSRIYNMSFYTEFGLRANQTDEFVGQDAVHLDAYKWVKRDSYLPQGSQGLKAVTKSKLGIDPVELDPELITPYGLSQPQTLAEYSVSDAHSTYHLYMKYVHPFIFSLCTILPMPPEEALRKGTGGLCESLLMVNAFSGNIIAPNKSRRDPLKLTNQRKLVYAETYVGGHVECLRSGIYRNDIPLTFTIDKQTILDLIGNLDTDLHFAMQTEKLTSEDVVNYDEVKQEVETMLRALLPENEEDTVKRITELPKIYHVDVAAMYPNIILTNRLQPVAIVDREKDCQFCGFGADSDTIQCQRDMKWVWRGDIFPAEHSEFLTQQIQAEKEHNMAYRIGKVQKDWNSLDEFERAEIVKKKMQAYCQMAYKRQTDTREEMRVNTVCQRENAFYDNAVREFRDRRYIYKGLLKKWQKNLREAVQKEKEGTGTAQDVKNASDLVVLYDSLQLAHKCILNSFYGYVMRIGARWYSMEMAGIVTNVGATLITNTRKLLEYFSLPLELDTDGIWSAFPSSFPDGFIFKTKAKGNVFFSYPCAMLNQKVFAEYANTQHQRLINPETFEYERTTECSIGFELDGPYKAMVLPASKEEGASIKKRYAVFNLKGEIAELKGFELKRRGELKLVKVFQESVFQTFLKGKTLAECYKAVGELCNEQLDILLSHGSHVPEDDIFDLLSETHSMSRALADYEGQKSNSITAARRLGDMLGEDVVKDKGLSCKFIVAKDPPGASKRPVSERTIPVAVFRLDDEVLKRSYLKKWLGITSFGNSDGTVDIRAILDWDYYHARLSSTIIKIVSIPAVLQGVENPTPSIELPDWLQKRLREETMGKSRHITEFFRPLGDSGKQMHKETADIEDAQIDLESSLSTSADVVDSSSDSTSTSSAFSNSVVDLFNSSNKKTVSESLQSLSNRSSSQKKKNLGKSKDGQITSKYDKKVIAAIVAQRKWTILRYPPGKENEDVPSMTENFNEWLAYHRKLWSAQRSQKHRLGNVTSLMTDSNTSDNTSTDAVVLYDNKKQSSSVAAIAAAHLRRVQPSLFRPTGATPLFTGQFAPLFRTHWQILQIAPSQPVTPSSHALTASITSSAAALNAINQGSASSMQLSSIFAPASLSTRELTMWVYANGIVVPIHIEAEKRIFVDCTTPQPSFLVTEEDISRLREATRDNPTHNPFLSSTITPAPTPQHFTQSSSSLSSSFNHKSQQSKPLKYLLPFIRSASVSHAILPHGLPRHHLFELSIDPSVPMEEWLSHFTSNPEVLGLFEAQISPVVRIMEQLGSCVRLKKVTATTSLNSVFKVDDFESLSPKKVSYLTPKDFKAVKMAQKNEKDIASLSSTTSSSASASSSSSASASISSSPLPTIAPTLVPRNSFPPIDRNLPAIFLYTTQPPSLNSSAATQSQQCFFGIYHNKSHTIFAVFVTPQSKRTAPDVIKRPMEDFLKRLAAEEQSKSDGLTESASGTGADTFRDLHPILHSEDRLPAIVVKTAETMREGYRHVTDAISYFLTRNEYKTNTILQSNASSATSGGKGKSNSNALSNVLSTTSTHGIPSSALILLQSCSQPASSIIGAIPSLASMPLAIVPPNNADAHLPSVMWGAEASRAFVLRLLLLSRWIDDTVHLSRSSALPLTNITHFPDPHSFALDMMFTRQLHTPPQPYRVSWLSSTHYADLGDMHAGLLHSQMGSAPTTGIKLVGVGKSKQTISSSGTSYKSSENESQQNLWEKDTLPEITNSGMYHSVCVELNVINLAVAAVIQSSKLASADESLGAEMDDEYQTNKDRQRWKSGGYGNINSRSKIDSGKMALMKDYLRADIPQSSVLLGLSQDEREASMRGSNRPNSNSSMELMPPPLIAGRQSQTSSSSASSSAASGPQAPSQMIICGMTREEGRLSRFSSSSQIFKKLHDLLTAFYVEVLTAPNPFSDSSSSANGASGPALFDEEKFALGKTADTLLSQFYRWISSDQSLLFDGALLETVHVCMKKMLFHLLFFLVKQGMRIVYASPSRVIIDTQRHTMREAGAMVHVAIEALRSSEMFGMMVFDVVSTWRCLMFLDINNFGGAVVSEQSKDDTSSESDGDGVGKGKGENSSDESSSEKDQDSMDEDESDSGFDFSDEEENSGSEEGSEKRTKIIRNKEGEITETDSLTNKKGTNSTNKAKTQANPSQNKSPYSLHYQWDILRYLPESLRTRFAVLIGRYILFCLEWMDTTQRSEEERLKDESKSNQGSRIPSLIDAVVEEGLNDDEDDEDRINKLGDVEGESLAKKKIMKVVKKNSSSSSSSSSEEIKKLDEKKKWKVFDTFIKQDIQTILDEMVRGYEKEIPPDSQNSLPADISSSSVSSSNSPSTFSLPSKWTNPPAVNFVIAVCHLLSLDPIIRSSVNVVKNNILNRLHVSAFATSSQFVLPSASIILTSFSCGYCGAARDLDLARDKLLIHGNWNCPLCGHPYSIRAIEGLLIELIDKQLAAYYTQDMRCPRCRLVQNSFFGESCKCTGRYSLTIDKNELTETITILNNIARFHNMNHLLEVTDGLIPMI
ncbi:DNA polymerase epsilon catalytic subunit A [Monocercomonoides exilis]|uniref:DNA polymerase epsilon catalytic subunit A n=1 Tax=Monocercomonoides exilis TaxID=2049356 RepID=UPI0035599358|nr:DNA polymerase epsilon catalytic subunit A [Monocercomonoides exilis]|eukprot:MONOS_5248.1-p1 / transcript=MONOS_5248.1 / gene=MONOS_5248 / organism=Monocercomonoides_exilis_PA203 / gene_product=DNA polymerase epsilon catalytic subunit A / transcript_product=DNA polymerase epsilon catalytic subunit A / location=Mono_scaffold00150:94879-103331(-) / protein_length=2691 / sequence_SO=supercontig / SO=protein_coding / is_pseudo=false